MKRLLALVVAVSILSGCRSRTPPAKDPFFGRTRVPPPGTGSISGGPADPYYPGPQYSPAPNPVTPIRPAPQVPSGPSAQPGAGGYQRQYSPPDGTFDYQGGSSRGVADPGFSQSSTRLPVPRLTDRARSGEPNSVPTLAANSRPGGTLAGRERVIQVLQPRPKVAAGSQRSPAPRFGVGSRGGEPQRLKVPGRAIDIMDLPRANSSTSATRPGSASRTGGFRPVPGSDEPDDSVVATAAVGSLGGAREFAPRSTYGYHPEYAWLRGKLEYSQIDRRWKLRYIPIDGTTDKYGGSVVLSDPTVLAGCERGDFVQLRGQLAQGDPKKGYAPTYEVAEIERLSKARP